MKVFAPIRKTLLAYLIVLVIILAIVVTLWLTIGVCKFTIYFTITLGIDMFILAPLLLMIKWRYYRVVISDKSIMYYGRIITKKNDVRFFFEKVELEKLVGIKVIDNKEECKKYVENLKVKSIILLDLGEEGIKYVIAADFTKKEVENIVQCITERIAAIS